jgi:hypothetical protein
MKLDEMTLEELRLSKKMNVYDVITKINISEDRLDELEHSRDLLLSDMVMLSKLYEVSVEDIVNCIQSLPSQHDKVIIDMLVRMFHDKFIRFNYQPIGRTTDGYNVYTLTYITNDYNLRTFGIGINSNYHFVLVYEDTKNPNTRDVQKQEVSKNILQKLVDKIISKTKKDKSANYFEFQSENDLKVKFYELIQD